MEVTTPHTIDVEATPQTNAVVPVAAPPQQLAVSSPLDLPAEIFKAGLDRRKENRKALMDWVRSALVEGTDFGSIPTKRGPSKPSLWKPGAEKICGMLGVIVHYPTLGDYEQVVLAGKKLEQIILRCEIRDASDRVIAEGVGARSLEQDYGDLNKCLKMASKSAHIDATLRLAGLSEVFTQDLEDLPAQQPAATPPPPPASGNGSKKNRPLAERIADLKKLLGDKVAWLEGYCKTYDVNGDDFAPALPPEGTIDNLSAVKVEYISTHYREFMERLENFIRLNDNTNKELTPQPAPQPAPPAVEQPIGMVIECPQCKKNSMTVTGDFNLCTDCGYRNFCKYCAHYDIVWTREKGHQYWRCKNCGRGEFAIPQIAQPMAEVVSKVARDIPAYAEAWREFVVPFGKEKGKPLAQADKKWLFGMWANYEVETHKDGRPRRQDWIESDRKFREALDWAGLHYEFKK